MFSLPAPEPPARRHRHRTLALPPTLALLALAALLALLTLPSAGAATAATNPPANIPLGALPPSCGSAPHSRSCQGAVMAALDRAHARLGLAPYRLPAGFYVLSGPQQLLVLCNLDRAAYNLPAVVGLSPRLYAPAAAGVAADSDPDPSTALRSFSAYGWSSDWAGRYGNILEAYYAWMFFDGWAGPRTSNVDCTAPSAAGCWGHRRNLLAFPTGHRLAMGAAVGRDRAGVIGYAVTLVWTSRPGWTSYSYRWADAQAAGAG